MAKYNYKAKTGENKDIQGIVEADNLKQATDLIHEKGYFIIYIDNFLYINTHSNVVKSIYYF